MESILSSITCVFDPETSLKYEDFNSSGGQFILQRPIPLCPNKYHELRLKDAVLNLGGRLDPPPYLLLKQTRSSSYGSLTNFKTSDYPKRITSWDYYGSRYFLIELDDVLTDPNTWVNTQNELLSKLKLETTAPITDDTTMIQFVWTSAEKKELTMVCLYSEYSFNERTGFPSNPGQDSVLFGLIKTEPIIGEITDDKGNV